MGDTLDTNIVVHYVRGDDVFRQIESDRHILTSPELALISIVTVGEINSLAVRWQWGHVKREQISFFLTMVRHISLETPQVLEAYSLLDDYSYQKGRRMGKNDLWIAASAYATGSTLVTTDNDFDHLSDLLDIAKY